MTSLVWQRKTLNHAEERANLLLRTRHSHKCVKAVESGFPSSMKRCRSIFHTIEDCERSHDPSGAQTIFLRDTGELEKGDVGWGRAVERRSLIVEGVSISREHKNKMYIENNGMICSYDAEHA